MSIESLLSILGFGKKPPTKQANITKAARIRMMTLTADAHPKRHRALTWDGYQGRAHASSSADLRRKILASQGRELSRLFPGNADGK